MQNHHISSLGKKTQIEREKLVEDSDPKKNILFLMLILIGVKGADSGLKAADVALKDMERKKDLIKKKNEQADKKLSELEELTNVSEGQRLNRAKLAAIQEETKMILKAVNMVENEIIVNVKVDLLPLKQDSEARANIASRFVDIHSKQFGNRYQANLWKG